MQTKINKLLTRASQVARGWAAMNAATIARHFSHDAKVMFDGAAQACGVYQRTPHLPRVLGSKLFPPTSELTLTFCTTEAWQVSAQELATIVGLAITKRPKHAFEIGTFDGRTTYNLWRNLPEATIHTLDVPPGAFDLPDGKVAGGLIKEQVASGAITQLYGDSLTFDYSPFVGKQQLVFVDAEHGYANAKSDTLNALRLVEGNEGVILWHDYATWPGVTQAVEEVPPLLDSPVDLYWIEGTTLAVLLTREGYPLKLKS